MSSQRLFFALWPDAEVRDGLAGLAQRLPARCGRKVTAEHLHITLSFLGNVPEDNLACLTEGVGAIRVPAFLLSLDRLGWFRRAGVVWVAPEAAPQELIHLAAEINKVVLDCGLEPDGRAYQPHLTLSRKARRPPRGLDFVPIHWNIRDFCLVQSVNHTTGPEYRVLKRWVLTPA
jgi:2'-5' RNA ligase